MLSTVEVVFLFVVVVVDVVCDVAVVVVVCCLESALLRTVSWVLIGLLKSIWLFRTPTLP